MFTPSATSLRYTQVGCATVDEVWYRNEPCTAKDVCRWSRCAHGRCRYRSSSSNAGEMCHTRGLQVDKIGAASFERIDGRLSIERNTRRLMLTEEMNRGTAVSLNQVCRLSYYRPVFCCTIFVGSGWVRICELACCVTVLQCRKSMPCSYNSWSATNRRAWQNRRILASYEKVALPGTEQPNQNNIVDSYLPIECSQRVVWLLYLLDGELRCGG